MSGPELLALVIGVSLYVSMGVVTVLEVRRRGGFEEYASSDDEAAGLVALAFALWWVAMLRAGVIALGKWARS